MSGVFGSPQDVLDELGAERWDLEPLWREEHPELIPFSAADVLYLLRCERVGLRKDLYSGTALVPFMSPQERRGLEEALGWMERWIEALEGLGITDERIPVSEPSIAYLLPVGSLGMVTAAKPIHKRTARTGDALSSMSVARISLPAFLRVLSQVRLDLASLEILLWRTR